MKSEKLSESQNITRCCKFCEFYQHEEVGDSDFGGVFSEKPSCLKYYDIDQETELEIPDFDREIERDCCVLDFWTILELDDVLSKNLSELSDGENDGVLSTYELFKERYKEK
jgi:hypothetical protein